MRHKYETRALILARTHAGEANTFVTLLTADLGLIHARAQSVRKQGAKLAHALATFAESDVVLVRGRDGWRVSGAVLQDNWFVRLPERDTRRRAARVSGLLLRMVAGESPDSHLFSIMKEFFEALDTQPEDVCDAAEILAVSRVLEVLGLADGEEDGNAPFTSEVLMAILEKRPRYIARINKGINASGL